MIATNGAYCVATCRSAGETPAQQTFREQTIDAIHAHAKTSIECDDADEYCHWAMSCAHLLRKQHDRALASLRRALEINPNCSIAYGSMGTMLAWAGEPGNESPTRNFGFPTARVRP